MLTPYEFKEDRYSSHRKIAKFLQKQHKRLKILDVGCSKGFMGRMLQAQHEMHGIDINSEDAKLARPFYKSSLILDISKKKIPYPPKSFDAIILADVIEHLPNPEETLHKLLSSLKKGGIIIISVPNIANFYVRMKLLLGNFDYEEKGIMDKTHLRFFTLKSFRMLLRHANLDIIKEESTPIPFPTISTIFSEGKPLRFVHTLFYWAVLVWRRLFAFQFIAYCKKK
jgi:2-polyprenyl-3-methyl-5-hydroxy-6-metoxy-1,4-benzoquinol methylase